MKSLSNQILQEMRAALFLRRLLLSYVYRVILSLCSVTGARQDFAYVVIAIFYIQRK